MNKIQTLTRSFHDYLQKTYSLDASITQAITVTLNTDEAKSEFGDLSSNAALVISKALKKNPRDIAQEITSSFKHELVKKIEIAGPGFLNFTLTLQTYIHLVQELFKNKEQFFKPLTLTPQKISLEFVSANPTGPLHLGHGRGGIIGDVLGNILTFIGHTVVKEFYINDAGSQIQKLGSSLLIRCQQLTGQAVPLPEDAYHGEYLIEIAKECIKEHGSDVIKKDVSFFATYGKEKLLARLQKTLALYGVTFDVWFSEKTLHDSGAITKEIKQLTDGGHVYEQDGAAWFKSTAFGDDKDRVLRKSSGELTYVAADIAYLDNKLQRGFDHLIMILGQDHHSYVVRLKGILQAMGKNPDMLDVILYQLVTLKEGGEQVRMSKRAGKMVTLQDIIDTVGTDVARFFYLNRKADAHLEFDIDLALKRTEENPVYYLQYAYVRIISILEKAQESRELSNITIDDAAHLTPAETMLLRKITALSDLLTTIANTYQTHMLTYYALELAATFHRYYSKTRVIDLTNINQSRARLLTLTTLKNTLELTLDLLKLSKPTKM